MRIRTCNLGELVADETFVRGMRKLSTRYCTLFDLGRTGMLFACEHLWLEPDVMCVSKPITGGYGAWVP